MARYRSVLGILFAVVATFLVSCGGPQTAKVTTYTPEMLEQIQILTPRVVGMRDRFPELEGYIQGKEWVNIRSFIHGPLGEIRLRLGRIANQLLPSDVSQAKALIDDLSVHLEQLDAAAAEYDPVESGKQYRLALDDLNAFFELVPSAAE
ncbi:MAG: photosystem II protein PsbQ [Leptolyngbyaceae cyanobacterium]